MPNIHNKIIISFKLYDQNLNDLLLIDGDDDKTVVIIRHLLYFNCSIIS